MADTFTITRSALIGAPPEKIFPLIDDFHAWAGWSPWEKVPGDNLEKTFEGPERGVGSAYAWVGKKTGTGQMRITETAPAALVRIDLDFLKPFKANNVAKFTLTPETGGTRVTWTMTGASNWRSKLMGLVMNVDKMVGGQFAQGLADLKAIAEG